MKTTLKTLSHRPLGVEHPYQQDPDERFPRQPLAGQPVSLGARTFPPSAAARVWATWTVAGESFAAQAALTAAGGTEAETMQFATSTIRLGGAEPGDTWRVSLPGFALGQEVKYRLYAASAEDEGGEELESPLYAFTVQDWLPAGDVSGVTLNSKALLIKFSAPANGLETCLQIGLAEADRLTFDLSATGTTLSDEAAGETPWQVLEQSPNGVSLGLESARIDFTRKPFSLRISRAGKTLLSTSRLPEWRVGTPGLLPEGLRLSFDSPADEGFYGLGERFNAFNLRGCVLDASLYEQYKNQGVHTYLPVPFFLSSRGYGFYAETSRFSAFDLAASQSDMWTCRAELGPTASMSFHLYVGAGPLENLRLFSRQVGLPTLPPEWAFGHWISSNEWNSQAIVMEQVRLGQLHDIPASVLVIEAWADEKTFYIWNEAEYKPKPADQAPVLADFSFPKDGLWPDPKGMIDELHSQGIRLLLWQNPAQKYLGGERHAQQDIDEAYMLEKNYCLRWPDGEPYRVRPFWFHDSLLLDFSNPDAVEWWMSRRAYLLDELGVDGFKTDGGEHLWGKDVVFANGMRGDEGLNLYPNLYVGAYHRFANQKRKGDALTFSRAGFTGAQAFPCHWAGDENSSWEAFQASLRAGLSAGLSGIPFWGWDIAGFSGEIPTAELYLRAAGMAAFCPIMQYHSEFNDHRLPLRDRTPWNIAERTGQPEVIDIYRRYVKLRLSLLPYITAEARHCAESGEALMRPLFLDWPQDEQAWQVEDQYCFGRGLLVAPVLQPGVSERRLYLPGGRWKDFWSEAEYAGPQWLTVSAPLDRIPVFQRLD